MPAKPEIITRTLAGFKLKVLDFDRILENLFNKICDIRSGLFWCINIIVISQLEEPLLTSKGQNLGNDH